MMQAFTTRLLLPQKEDVRSELSEEREDAVFCRLTKREWAAESPVYRVNWDEECGSTVSFGQQLE